MKPKSARVFGGELFTAAGGHSSFHNVGSSRHGRKILIAAFICVVAVARLMVASVTHSQKSLSSAKANLSTTEVTVRAAGRGRPYLNLQDGHGVRVRYQGDQTAAAVLQSEAAQARTLASADFDGNGTQELLTGFGFNGAGMITLQQGNSDAFAPADDSVFVRMQNGFNPDSLLPEADVYAVPVSPDFLVTGNFTHDSKKDVVFAAKGGALYLMAGDGSGRLGSPQEISLPGGVTALAAGEFRTADGFTDLAVGIAGEGGNALWIFDDATSGFKDAVVQQPLAAPASGIEFGGLDDDPFMDVAVAAGPEVLVLHGWGRNERAVAAARLERINVRGNVSGLALGEFVWDRKGNSEIAALSDDGTVHILQNARLDNRPFTEMEALERTRGKLTPKGTGQNLESARSWQPGRTAGWSESRSFTSDSFTGVSSPSLKPLLRTNLAGLETDDLMLIGESQAKLEIVHSTGPTERATKQVSVADDLASTSLDLKSAPVAVLTLPKKLNGVTDMVVLSAGSVRASIVPNAPNTTITVDRTDDPTGAALTAASACTAAGSDCSLRGALQFANLPTNNNTTISLPANTYILSINGTSAGGCDGNTVGDLGANQTMSIVGAGAATTIIRQTATGPANDGDRVMCMNEPFTLNLVYNFSGFTLVGGRDGTAAGTGAALGGGGIIGGEKGNVLTMTNVVLANNQVTVLGSANIGGGGIQWTGGDMNVTNCTFGGTSLPGAYTDRTSTNTGNLQGGSGGGFMYTPSAPQHTAATGILTVSGSTITHNTAGSVGSGGGGADILNFAFALPGGFATSGSATIGTSTFSNNQAAVGHGGAIDVESLPTTVATTSFTNNSSGFTGGIYVGGGSLLLDGTTPGITFSGNTTTQGGSSVTTVAPVNVAGTNTTIGGSIEVAAGGTWTNNTGSTLSPTDVVVDGGGLVMNNSTMNIGGNLSIGPNSTLLFPGSFSGGTGTVNLAGNFTFDNAGNSTFTAGTGTFNFNGTGSQTISNDSMTFFNLTDSNVTQPLTLNNSFAVNGTLNVNGANAVLSPVAATVISGTGTLTGTGTARASRIAGTPDFLNQYTITNKTLTNLTIDYNGAGNQTVNNTPAYSQLRISGSGIKTLQGNTVITGNLNIAAATFAGSTFNFALGGNWTNAATFTPGTGTVTFQGTSGTQLLSGNTTFFNLTLNNAGAITNFGNTTTTIGNDLVASAGTMDGSTSTIVFTGVTDNAGAISGAVAKNFFNLQINSPATISNNAGANITIENNYTNAGTFTQAAGLTTVFDVDNSADGAHTLSGAGATTFGNFTINASNAVDAGSHNFSVTGAAFTSTGTFTGNTGTVTFNGSVAQSITGDGAKNFGGLLVNNANGVSVLNGAQTNDASVLGILTLNTDLTVVAGAILQQSGTSAGVADVIGTVRRTDLGGVTRSFGNLNNTIQINSGTPPTQLDFNLVKAVPTGFPAGVKVVPRTYTLTPTGGAGISATLRLRYIDPADLSGPGITESRLVLWKDTTGSDNWVAQGGTVDTSGNHVTHTGISSFSEWAIAEAADLTLSKANNVSGAAVTGQSWNWTLTATNTGSPATFTAGQTILSDNLPNSNLNYGTPSVQNVSNITGSGNINCSIVSNDLTCTANGGSVTFDSNIGASKFDVVFSATPQTAATFQNPRTGGGIARVDPNSAINESNESNNDAASNSVVVSKANTSVAVSSSLNPSVFGQAVTFTATVSVTAPGTGTPTGNVQFFDGASPLGSPVSLTGNQAQLLTSALAAGNHTISAQYQGDSGYNISTGLLTGNPQVVNKADTTLALNSSANPINVGQSVDFTATVSVTLPGTGTPTGTVDFIDTSNGNALICNDATLTVGSALCTTSSLTVGTHNVQAVYSGDSNFRTSTSNTVAQVINAAIDIKVNDAKQAEPTSGAASMLFTLTLSDVAPGGGLTVNYQTASGGPTPATGGATCDGASDYVTTSGTATVTAGSKTTTIPVTICADGNVESDETLLMNISSPSAGSIVDAQAVGTITNNKPGTFLISELRTSGPGGLGDDYVEFYNNTDSPLTVAASDASAGYGLFKMGADCGATPVLIGTIPNGTVIPARGHYLIVGSQYSLANYGGVGAAAGNLTMSADIESDRNVAVFSTADLTNISSANRLDAVGFGTNTGNVCELLREGATLGATVGSTTEHSFFRHECAFVSGPGCTTAGTPKDTNINATDFKFADTAGTFISGLQQALGAPAPQNLASPIKRDLQGVNVLLLDGLVSNSLTPNRSRSLVSDPPNNSTFGTLTIRRRVQNLTGSAVTRLRFRIVEMTTFPSPGGGIADLRARSGNNEVSIGPVNDPATCTASGAGVPPCNVTVQGTTLEAPPNQPNGGGFNSTFSAGTITLGSPLANGASINVNFLLGVQTTGNFRFLIIVEALP